MTQKQMREAIVAEGRSVQIGLHCFEEGMHIMLPPADWQHLLNTGFIIDPANPPPVLNRVRFFGA